MREQDAEETREIPEAHNLRSRSTYFNLIYTLNCRGSCTETVAIFNGRVEATVLHILQPHHLVSNVTASPSFTMPLLLQGYL